MTEYSENEEKLVNLIAQDENVVNKLYSIDKIENLKNYLESHDIYFLDGELKKLFIIFQYFNKNKKESNNNNLDLDNSDVSGGKSEENLVRNFGIGKDLYDVSNTELKFWIKTKV